MKTKLRLLPVTLIALVLALPVVAAACGDDEEATEAGAGQELETLEPGVLTVGSDIPFPPFEQGRAPNYKGFDIDMVNEIAERVGLEVQIEDTAFDTIFRDLAQGKFDMVASATTITPEREQRVDFSDPYYLAEQALLVQQGSDIQAVEDLAEATVGAQDGTTGEAYAQDETEAGSVRGFPEGPDAINALQAGQVQAVIIDLPVAQDALEGQQEIELATSIDTGEEYGFSFQEDADPLRERVNETLAEIKDDGTYAEIYGRWFDKEPPEEILEATHEPQ